MPPGIGYKKNRRNGFREQLSGFLRQPVPLPGQGTFAGDTIRGLKDVGDFGASLMETGLNTARGKAADVRRGSLSVSAPTSEQRGRGTVAEGHKETMDFARSAATMTGTLTKVNGADAASVLDDWIDDYASTLKANTPFDDLDFDDAVIEMQSISKSVDRMRKLSDQVRNKKNITTKSLQKVLDTFKKTYRMQVGGPNAPLPPGLFSSVDDLMDFLKPY